MSYSPRSPLEPGSGASFPTLRLARDGTAWIYRPTLIARLFPRIFIYSGYAAIVGAVIQFGHDLLSAIGLLGGGVLFVRIGHYLLDSLKTGARFDTMSRRIDMPGSQPFWPNFQSFPDRQVVRFDQVAELEILEKEVDSIEGSNYINYECNLVLNDRRRFNLVSHPDIKLIASEAKTLARLLNVPVHDSRMN